VVHLWLDVFTDARLSRNADLPMYSNNKITVLVCFPTVCDLIV
jgi:hypothetical protein